MTAAADRGVVMWPATHEGPKAGARYPRGWAGKPGFAAWKIAVALVMLLGVPVAIWLLVTLLFK